MTTQVTFFRALLKSARENVESLRSPLNEENASLLIKNGMTPKELADKFCLPMFGDQAVIESVGKDDFERWDMDVDSCELADVQGYIDELCQDEADSYLSNSEGHYCEVSLDVTTVDADGDTVEYSSEATAEEETPAPSDCRPTGYPDQDERNGWKVSETDSKGHEWCQPSTEWVGGIDSNPGVFGLSGTALRKVEVCKSCGMTRETRYAGSQRNPGQASVEVSYSDSSMSQFDDQYAD